MFLQFVNGISWQFSNISFHIYNFRNAVFLTFYVTVPINKNILIQIPDLQAWPGEGQRVPAQVPAGCRPS